MADREGNTENPLMARFAALIAWWDAKFAETRTSMGLIRSDLPAYYRAIREQIAVMEAAYFKGELEGMTKAEENIKKFIIRAAERIKSMKTEAA